MDPYSASPPLRSTHPASTPRSAVRVNGHTLSAQQFGRVTAFAEQQDVHFPSATVREALEFSAVLRLDATQVSAEQRGALIEDTIAVLELGPLAGRVVSSLAPSEVRLSCLAVASATPAHTHAPSHARRR